MVEYKIVKYCKRCRVRFVVKNGESRKYYCDDCYKKIKEDMEEEK